jgi:biopolymer transport protein TolR
MRLLRNERPRGMQLRLTAMVDIVFLLVVFFMTVTRLSSDRLEDIPLPLADQGGHVMDHRGRVIINISIAGHVVVLKQAVSDEQLMAMVQRALKEKPRTKCVLRAHRGVPFRRVQEVLGVLARAGVWRIAYAVRDED